MNNTIRIMQRDINTSPHHYIIIQQVNCKGVMGAGVALSIAKRYPFVRDQYLEFCKGKTSEQLLGNCLLCTSEASIRKVVCNFSQDEYGSDGKTVYTDYSAVRECFRTIAEHFNKDKDKLAIPYRYGCGLANGSWKTISKIICEELDGYDFIFYQYN